MIAPVCFTYTYFQASKDTFRTKLNRIISSMLFDWLDWLLLDRFDNQTHSKLDVRFCLSIEPN